MALVLPFKKPISKSVLQISAAASSTEYNMDLFGVIGGDFWGDGGITKEQFAQILNKVPNNCKTINMRMSSPGGDVFEGRAIFNMMKDHPCSFDVNIIAESCSIASVIAMAGDSIHMGEGAVMLVHRCYAFTIGNSLELTKLAADLNTIDNEMVATYCKKTKMTSPQCLSLMDENRYMSPEEAKSRGFVDTISTNEDDKAAASVFKIAAFDIDRKAFHLPSLPENLQPGRKTALAALDRMKRARI